MGELLPAGQNEPREQATQSPSAVPLESAIYVPDTKMKHERSLIVRKRFEPAEQATAREVTEFSGQTYPGLQLPVTVTAPVEQ